MAARPIFVVMLLATLAFAMVAESSMSSHFEGSAITTLARQSTDGGLDDMTTGLIGDTLFEDEEMMMPSESARRTLWDRDNHISYRAMARNNIPCNRREIVRLCILARDHPAKMQIASMDLKKGIFDEYDSVKF
ncbi:hypothetical protein K7X08_012288 [Anisodus acutangulus]|uniref:Melanin-concentrating hormone n=1 Tax=Anisodus acutangulus TaxID=402998 RepID=A0A9Q1LAF7_9SOLA|nr:hypothetical protein K7X08_012288 [Anisodus acutangulus]